MQVAATWVTEASAAAVMSCRAYGVDGAWTPAVRDCTLGIGWVESRFGTSPRYRAKGVLQRLHGHARLPRRFAPRALGPAQINRQRADYLAQDAALDHDLDVRSLRGAVEGTALGLAKAISLYYAGREEPPLPAEQAIIVITHNAGWMAPRVARLQRALARLGLLPAAVAPSGFVGAATRFALDRAAERFACRPLRDEIGASGLQVPPAWGLTHPGIAPLVRRCELFEALQVAASRAGEDLDEPLFPTYEIRRWYTGRITANGYARTVLAVAENSRKKSIANLGGSDSSRTR